MEPDIPWWVVFALVIVASSLLSILVTHSRKDDAPVTKGDLKEQLAANNLELQGIRDAADKLPMEALGTDGAECARLPEGTNLVKTPAGDFRLALPVNLGVSFGPATAVATFGVALDKRKDKG